jgi:hypothetical protein
MSKLNQNLRLARLFGYCFINEAVIAYSMIPVALTIMVYFAAIYNGNHMIAVSAIIFGNLIPVFPVLWIKYRKKKINAFRSLEVYHRILKKNGFTSRKAQSSEFMDKLVHTGLHLGSVQKGAIIHFRGIKFKKMEVEGELIYSMRFEDHTWDDRFSSNRYIRNAQAPAIFME